MLRSWKPQQTLPLGPWRRLGAARTHISHMASYRLRSDLRYCAIGTRIICLDLSASRYFLLEDVAAEAFEAFAKSKASEEQTAWLVEGNLVEAGVPTVPPSLAPDPTESIFDGPTGASHPWLILEAVASQWRARRNLAARQLGTLLIPTGLPETGLDPCRLPSLGNMVHQESDMTE